MPKSAPFYLDILDSIKNITWHIREITRNVLAGHDKIVDEHSRDQ
ncbi:MAG: hypothetical protein ACE5KZ_11605 [Candidatus Scalinduaceae bacterium]